MEQQETQVRKGKNKKNKRDKEKKNKNHKNLELQQIEKNVKISEEKVEEVLSLNFSQRKDRFLVVTTVMGVLIIVLKYLMQIGIDFFSRFYINNINVLGIKNVFISFDQIISVICISSCILLVSAFLIYCICELCNFQSPENNFRMEKIADKWYALVFKIAICLVISDITSAMIIFYFFSNNKLAFIVMCICGVCIIKLAIKYIKNRFQDKNKIKSYVIMFIKTILWHGALSVILFCVFFLVAHNDRGTLITYFENENIILEFQGAYCPDEIKCIINNEGKIQEKKYLYDNCGVSAWIEKISATEKGKDDNTIVEENYYCYKYEINIKDMHGVGNNVVDIIFVNDNTEYCIHNMFYYNKTYDYTENQMQMDL